ncbi:lectin subunit alpha-like [Calliphora vicina]|uniref:lectin subunit alpha-like n=1 Tax=Calliphora vicina TaxID=7373 RepID=UPI00325C1458
MRFTTLYHIVVVLIIFKLNGINSIGRFYTTANHNEYYINEDQKYTWFDGLSECRKMNMSLVTIETSIKSKEINDLVKATFNRSIILWVGGIMTNYPDSRNYIWISTGQQFNYTYWKDKNPDFSLNNEYCIQIGCSANMEWNDNVCETKYGFICEYQKLDLPLQMENKYKDCQQELKDHEQLKENLRIVTIERNNLQHKLKQQNVLQQELEERLHKINEERNFETIIEKNYNLQLELQKQQLELGQHIKKGSQNLQLALQKQLEWQHFIEEKLLHREPEEKQQNKEKFSKYSDLSFQFNRNTYVLPNAQLKFDGNH